MSKKKGPEDSDSDSGDYEVGKGLELDVDSQSSDSAPKSSGVGSGSFLGGLNESVNAIARVFTGSGEALSDVSLQPGQLNLSPFQIANATL